MLKLKNDNYKIMIDNNINNKNFVGHVIDQVHDKKSYVL